MTGLKQRGCATGMIASITFAMGCGDMPISYDRPVPGAGESIAAGLCEGAGGSVTTHGGTVDCLSFAIVGDTRPSGINGTSTYPTSIITKIYQDIQAENPRPAFAVGTGDYIFATPNGTQSIPQFDKYLAARANFSGPMFPALGNHECTGATISNCGVGNASGTPANFTNFLDKLGAQAGQTRPYYSIDVKGTGGAWTAKFVFVAANAWDAAQAAWLETTMSKPTTYTFVIRHEPAGISGGPPGLDASEAILAAHPFTLKLVGHTHTYKYVPAAKEVVVGIGGAPLTSGHNYGYVVVRQRVDGAVQFATFDYQSHALLHSFAVDANGNPAPSTPGTPTPAPSATPTATPAVNLVANGGFEGALSDWTLGGAKSPIGSTAHPHAGNASLRCGATQTSSEPNGDSWAWQAITVPANGATLSFWYYAASADPANDWQEAKIQDDTGHDLSTVFHLTDDGRSWTAKTVDLSPWAGRAIRLWFNTHSNGGTTPTTLWVDDVSVLGS